MRERGAPTWIKYSTSDLECTQAAELAKEGATKPDTNEVRATIPPKFDLEGAQLSALTQAKAYEGIRETKPAPPRLKTDIRLDMTRHAVFAATGTFPTDAKIWNAMRHPDIARPIHNFLWKTTHQLQRIGEFWDNVPTLENRGVCSTCGETEDMDHILFDCKAVGCAGVWSHTRALWKMKGGTWPGLERTCDVLASALADIKDAAGQRLPGATRLFKILVTESAFLIWKLRNERVIGTMHLDDRQHTEKEVKNRWLSAVNERLRLDITMAHGRWGKGTIPKKIVLSTWSNTLHDENALPNDWTTNTSEVLVGIGVFERRRGRPHRVAPG